MQDFGTTARISGRDFERGRRPIELATAMVGHDDAIDPDATGLFGVVGMGQTLDHEAPGPSLANARKVIPGLGDIGIRLHQLRHRPGIGTRWCQRSPTFQDRKATACQISVQPARMGKNVGNKGRRYHQGQIEAIAHVALALGFAWNVNSVYQHVHTTCACPIKKAVAGVTSPWRVELEPNVPGSGHGDCIVNRAGADA